MAPADDNPSAEEVLICEPTGGAPNAPPDLRLLHYNDVYHVEAGSREPVGGYARFQTLVNYYRDDKRFDGLTKLLTFFSGDAFNPSIESSITKGSHMVPVLNNIGTDVSCVGNHDLDFGVKQYRHLTAKCNFPWLLANVLDPALGDGVPLGNAKKTVMLTASNGIKVGVIGLAEREWLDTINALPPDIIYKSASETAKELIPYLKAQGAEIIICVSHQREPNDNKLAKQVGGSYIDIILGGHDHYYSYSLINGTQVLRSGTDFKQLSYIEAWRNPSGDPGWQFKITRRDIVSSIPQDPSAMALVEEQTRDIRKRLDKPIGYTAAPLDARFTTVRTRESNIGNFVCDLMRYYYSAECCIMASGTIRGDQIYPPGLLKLRDLVNCFPFEDPVVVLKVTGKAIVEALENGVSNYPALEGRFPQVSNICFEVDYGMVPGKRVGKVTIGDEDVDEGREYVLATRGYMGRGKGEFFLMSLSPSANEFRAIDGYTSLLIREEGGVAEEIVSEENGVLISTILRQYFMSLKVLGKWKRWGKSMDSKFSNIQTSLQKNSAHAFHEPSPTSPVSSPVQKKHPRIGKMAGESKDGDETEDPDAEEDEDDGAVFDDSFPIAFTERQVEVVRKVMRKWWRVAGLKGNPVPCDELGGGEFQVNWTKAIAPRLEGRIVEVGKGVVSVEA
ncbi:Metallo-dependent phosphatase [Pyrenophora tritici-repentis]|uniref:Metallo-dependent phosphatase n=1 Tax=Pyrenophora tritici-repentis TaxID=45151 RepID=A0A922NM64_9PLEO|nr:Metallo-dependent phosphatase [Pyrenophora tritici-repentis]KAI0609864.1 Metallo-dependent phosphatase [Pyrenophora tritici-repentis]KAI0621885.1 Metallo-dependent phosphatase [Pyrenophora tritici-repentis]KAI1518451.1 Metallo-dependent phosphatase [Pyrenophora tritici-repentis]KAI1588938.1 UshA 5'-nucleotidase 2'3'-cyclic phosphodiesterase [Pyrenophora tritici-repentis]